MFDADFEKMGLRFKNKLYKKKKNFEKLYSWRSPPVHKNVETYKKYRKILLEAQFSRPL